MKKFFVAMMVAFTMVMSVMAIGSEKAYAAENKQMTCKQYASTEERRANLINDYMENVIWIAENYPRLGIAEVVSMDAVIENDEIHLYMEAFNDNGEYLQEDGYISTDELFEQWLGSYLVRYYGEQGIWEW